MNDEIGGTDRIGSPLIYNILKSISGKNERISRFEFGEFTVEMKKRMDLRKLYVEASSLCNLRCKMCFRESMKEEKGIMDFKLFQKIFNDSFPELEEVVIGGIGEPLTNPKIIDMVDMVKKMGLRVKLTTNGFLMTDEKLRKFLNLELDEMVISCETGDIGHPNVEFVSRLLKKISKMRNEMKMGKPILTISTVLTKENLYDFPQMAEKLIESGADSMIVSNLLPVREEFADLVLYDGKIDPDEILKIVTTPLTARIHTDLPNFNLVTERYCPFVNEKATVIRWDGEVSPCYRFLYSMEEYHFNRKKEVVAYSFGNVRNRKLSDIWMSDEYLRFRFKVMMNLFPSCTDCKFREYCHFLEEVKYDCWGNNPTCADCLWWRRIAICP